MSIRAHRFAAVGALAVAAVAAPVAIALSSVDTAQPVAGPACLATGSSNGVDMPCLSYSNGNGVNVGTPSFGFYGPDSGSGGGFGVNTGPVFPGQTWTQGIGN